VADTGVGTAAAATANAGAAAAASSAAHIGHRLYADAVRTASKAAQGAVRNAQSEAGDSPFAHAIKDGRRPPDSLVQDLDNWHQFHTTVSSDIDEALDKSNNVYRQRFREALRGAAGDDGLQNELSENHKLWGSHQDMHNTAGLAAYTASCKVQRVQAKIDDLAQAGEQEFNDAVRRRDPIAALDVWQSYSGQADDIVVKNAPVISGVLQQAGFNIPLDTPPGVSDGTRTDGKKKPDTDGKRTTGKGDDPHHSDGTTTPDGNRTDGQGSVDPTTQGQVPGPVTPGDDATRTWPAGAPGTDATRTLPAGLPRSLGTGSSGNGISSGTGGAGSITSGLGSALRPSSMGSAPGTGAATSPASAMPRVPSTPTPATASPLANAGSSFQSGMASGMGASGGMAPAVSSQQPLQPFVSQQPAVAAPGSGVGAAGVPAAGASFAGPGDAGVSGGHASSGGSGSGPVAGGGSAMMPPPAAMGAAQPLAPYSPPGAGAGGGGAATAPAAGASGQSTPSGGSGSSAGPGGAAPPVLAGNPGSSAAMSALAGSATEVNPDLITAQRVLAGLVRGSEDSAALVVWAVSVLRWSLGSQIVVANNMGGGWYLPSTVFLPATARLAVNDPSLPMGWAEDWMGCQKPSKILVDHFERLRKLVAGVTVSAIVTTELWPEPPSCGGDFLGLQHRDALSVLSDAPKLDAAHQHRLAVIDVGLAQRIQNLDRGGDVSVWAAASLTSAIYRAARNPDDTGSSLVTDDEDKVLEAVNSGTANDALWLAYDHAAEARDNGSAIWPDRHAPQDNDGSDRARAIILWYRHYYRMGRIIELVQCWKTRPPALAEVAYCGIVAGFGTVVMSAILEIEQRLGGKSS